ncbi:MAG: hypothetical protein WD512_17345 [Candidatus Paceibacterota bacterium]
MVSKSWLVTLTPLVLAVATTLKAVLFDQKLTDQEVEILKYIVITFIGSGAIGAYRSVHS